MRLSLIAAVAENGVIGRDGQLPWRLPADLARFKTLTLGHTLIMGRRTYASIGRPLPGRRIIVLSRRLQSVDAPAATAPSLAAAVTSAREKGETETFVAGGAAVYRAALTIADRLYLTHVQAATAGDVRFPAVDWTAWRIVDETHCPADARNELASIYRVCDRVR